MILIISPKAELAAKQLDLKVIGWYQANARNKDNALHENAVRVANVIKKNSGDAIVFMVSGIVVNCWLDGLLIYTRLYIILGQQ